MALSWSTVQAGLAAWIKAALPSCTVIWADQPDGAPLPSRPFATLRLISRDRSTSGGNGDEAQTSAAQPGIVKFAQHRQHTLSVSVYATDTHGDGHAAALAGAAARALNLETVRLALRRAGVKAQPLGGVRDLTAALATRTESRAQCDFELATVDVLTEDQGWIETVTTTGVHVDTP